jgi:ABC-type xylose transport system permease subunit
VAEPKPEAKPMYASWQGPPTKDPVILRKRRVFLVATVILLGTGWLLALKAGVPNGRIFLVMGLLIVVFATVEVTAQLGRRNQPK